VVLDAVLAGQGIARMTDITLRPHLRSGRLVTALDDWQTLDSPPVTLLYHPNGRRVPRVRAFLDFVTSLFAALAQDRADGGTQLPGVAMPPWWGREGRASRMRRV
jgi:DNA-binding transcriptional LysR family regulator